MGIQQTKSLLKTYYSKPHPKDTDGYLSKAFSPESLQISEFLENFWDTNANDYFDWTNVQENKKLEEIQKEKEKLYIREKYILSELPLNPTITDNLFSLQTLSEFKEAFNSSDSKYFSNSFIRRMNVILIAYVKKILSTFNENSSLECIGNYFNSRNDEDIISKVNLELGMNLFIRLLDDTCNKDSKLKEETLNFLVNNSLFIRPLAFWGESKKHFVLDKSLNDIVNHLKKIISDKDENPTNKYKAFKVLLNLSFAKGSLRNLLDFVDYFKYIDDYIDLNYEINLFKNEFIKLSLSLPTNENIKVRSKLWNFKLQTKKKEGEEVKADHKSITNDNCYIYLFSSNGYIAKIGTGYNNTMLGKIYLFKENYRVGETGTISCIENILYYRSTNIDPNPIICLSTETLEEIPINYELNIRETNHLWVENRKQEFEFPHISYKDMNEIIEKKKNIGAEDKANLRPTTSSPMTTDGRYIYIFSKWYDDVDVNLEKGADDDDDEPKNINKKTSISIYGVDIYDPLSNMCHVKSIKFNLHKNKEDEERPDLLKQGTVIYTNGNIFMVDKYRFNLSSGEEEKVNDTYVDGMVNVCYDIYNNNIWGIKSKLEGSNDKLEIICFFNNSAKPIVEYPKNNDKYMPCSLEKIIQDCEDLIQLKNLTSEVSIKTFLRENTLNVLGLEDSFSKEFKKQNLISSDNSRDLTIYKKAAQCLILSTIAKLSEYYGQVLDVRSANSDEERGKILAQACRRPYCVKLEPETFEILINFINEFSLRFINKCEDKELRKLDNYCLLSTIKILRTNLNCLSISNLEIDYFIKDKNNNPFFKVKEFIFKIFDIYHNKFDNCNDDIDIIKALYEECKIILSVSVNILYPNYYHIIEILECEINNFKDKRYSQDIVKCILEWMSNEDNMRSLLLKLKGEEIKRIFKIFKIVSSWEVDHFRSFIKSLNTVSVLPKNYITLDDEITAFKFTSNMQIEILKSVSKKLLNDNYEDIENEQLLFSFSEIIFENVLDIFKSLRKFLEELPHIMESDWSHQNSSEPQEEMIDTFIPVKDENTKKTNTLDEFKKGKYKEIWNLLIDKVISSDLLLIRTFNFHIDCLAILSSNFVISSLMLHSYHDIVDEMNKIYSLLKECEMSEEKKELDDYKELIFESEHPYLSGESKWFTLEIPGEKEIFIEFDPLCNTKQNCAYVNLYTDMNMNTYAFPQYTTLNTNFPKETLTWTNGPLYLYFYSDSCSNSSGLYGFKVKIHNGKNNSFIKMDNKFSAMMRSVCWVSCKCSAQLLRGNFTKSLTNISDEDDMKYNNILNSKLFAGGIDFDDITKDNDPILMNIINIFESIRPENELITKSPKSSERLLLNSIVIGDNNCVIKIISLFQKQFSKEVVWSHIGGEQADSLVRAAFSALIRHSGQSRDFQELIDIIEMNENQENLNTENDELLSKSIVSHHNYLSLYKKWQSASRMRTWLVEKKKNVDEALEKNKPRVKKDDENNEKEEENNSDEIMKKIIEQTIVKAKFLIKLNPSPAFSSDESKFEKKNIFVRSSSLEFETNDDWKRRLHQWKAVQRSKKVIKSVEDEANENLTSLTSSVLMCLQSTISSKRLFNKIKIATIRAKGREIGLMTIKKLLERINHPNLIQDLLSWFCSSLRKADNKICHYLDNAVGCGHYFEERIKQSFHEFIVLLINKFIKTEKPNELRSFVDALMWKYSANDHKFLVDHSIFLILWGTYNESIKQAWGKSIKKTIDISDDKKTLVEESIEFTNELLEVFEILSNICLERSIIYNTDKKNAMDKKQNTNINIKFPTLERQVSIIDDSNSENLVRHILDVIFGEVMKSIQSYLRYRGISYNLWKQYESYEEEKDDDKKKKKKTENSENVPRTLNNRSDSIEENKEEVEENEENENAVDDVDPEESREEEEVKVNEEEKKEKDKDKDKNKEETDLPYYYDSNDLLNLYDELRINEKKNNKRTQITANELLNLINKQNEEIYDPEFLNRLLSILYKCSCQYNSDKMLISIANPLNISSIIKLMRICSTQNKIIIAKILKNTCSYLPEEILIEAVDLILQQPEDDKFIEMFIEKRKRYNQYDKVVFIEFIIDTIKDIREKIWKKDIESSGCLIVTNELIQVLRKLWYSENWVDVINSLFNEIIDENNKDYLRKEIILCIFGADYVGLGYGAKIRVRVDDFKGINFNFIKKDYVEHYNFGTVIGFSSSMEEIWTKKQVKDPKKKKQKNISVSLTPNNSLENSAGVLLHDSILKDEFNIIDLSPKVFQQHEVLVIQDKLNYENFKLNKENIIPIIGYMLYEKNSSSESVNLKSNMFRFINNFVKDEKCLEQILSMDENYLNDIIYELIMLSNKQIQHKSHYLNLEILEEKKYRIMNYCIETNYSLSEIPKISLSFRKPNHIIVRCSSENLLNIVYSVIGLCNYENLSKINEFITFADERNENESDYILSSPENINKFFNKKLIISHSVDSKLFDDKIKKYESCSLVILDKSSYNELINIYDEMTLKGKRLEDNESFRSILSTNEKSSIIEELEEFGFNRDIIEKEISNSTDVDINSIIANLIEYKEKRKEIEDKNEEVIKASDKEEEDIEENDNEPKNECFTLSDVDNAKVLIPEYYEELIINDNDDSSLLYKSFKVINQKLNILYSRRIILSIITKLIDENNSKSENILNKIPTNMIVNLLKLLTHEGLFLNSINFGSEILTNVKNILTKIYSKKTNKCNEISEFLTQNTLKDLETVLKNKKTNYEFISNNEETLINRPMIFFSIWILMIMNEYSSTQTEYTFVIDILAGLITKINNNKQIRWFIVDLLIQLISKINNKLNDQEYVKSLSIQKNLKDVDNVKKLREFLDDSINKESKKNLSKRSQMISEFLIYLEDVNNKLNILTHKKDENLISNILDTNSKSDNFVIELLSTFDMMKEFFDKKYLKYLAWIEMNPEIINSSKLIFESSHLYPKAPHSFLINIPNTTALEININSDTLLDNGDAIVFSYDKNCLYPIECYANRTSKKSFTIPSSHTFVNFPSNYLTEIYSFGTNTYTRLGQTGIDIFSPKLIESLSSVIVKDIAIGDTFVMVLTNNGELLSCGNGIAAGLKQTSGIFTKAININSTEKINSEGISIIGVNSGSTIVATKDYSFYSIGANAYGQLGQAWTSPVNDITSMSFQKKIKQISVSDTHSMLVSCDGQVYHLGNNDYYQNGELSTNRNNSPKILFLNKNLTCEMVSTGEYFTIFIMRDILTGKKKLYAAGWSKLGRTGTGKDEETHGFKAISTPEIENLEFKYITSSKLTSAAISVNNKLYTWGNNPKGQLGLGHYNDVLEPTLVTFFDKYNVEDVALSNEHTLVIVKDDEKNKISVFGYGDSSGGKLGEIITSKSEKKDTVPTPIKVTYFEGKNPTRVYAGPRASIVMCKLKPYENLRDIHNVSCSVCCKNPIIGNLFADIDSTNLNLYCSNCALEDKPQLVFKAPLKDYNIITENIKKYSNILSEENYEDITVNCKQCKENIKSCYIYLENKTKFYICCTCIDQFPSSITSAKVYIKVTKILKNVDFINTSDYYENSISYGHKFSVTPILNDKGCETIIEKHQNSFGNFVEDINEYNKFDVYEQLVDLLNDIAQKSEKSIFTFQPKDLSFKKEELSLRNSLEKCSSELLRKLFIILKILNNKIKELLPFIDFSKVLNDNQRLSYFFNKITPLIFWDTKNELIKYYLEKTASDFETTEIKINRLKVRKFIEKGKPDHTGEYTLFGNIFQFLKNKSFRIFRKKEGGNNGKLFNVTFIGEASIDAGGPYREALTQACSELQSSALPLFIPSPNQKNESGLFREKWVVNPSSKSTIHLEMYKIFGGLIGYAMRTGEFMNLDLPSIFWKQLLEVSLDRKDLECIDRYTIQCLDDIINIHKKGVTSETFNFYVDQKFTTCLSDGTEVEVIEGGKDIELTYHDRVKYCELVEKIRLEESKIQMAAIRSGLELVIPMGLLKLLSWKEIETLVCGKPILDVDLLKTNTVYRGCSDSDFVIQNLWKCLEEFSAEERSMYLRFVWGRSRLPLTSKDFPMKHRIEILHHNNPDVALPTSHTCFFSLEIPKYSTYEILKDKLKYAITHCQAIDTDGRPYEIWQDED